MARTVGIGLQDFEKIIKRNVFYVDKTMFIKEWWESMDDVTLITRPRRFGKTLTMSMVEHFFSVQYAGSRLFQGMNIWKEDAYRELQGKYPVISLSFERSGRHCESGPAADQGQRICCLFGSKRRTGRKDKKIWICFQGEKGVDWKIGVFLLRVQYASGDV